ncbi:MAG: hypothetical protein FWH20_00025 [Oscillospiraceae bacterium]|nr:hypothetical protein [Oscillospiraceae bacterium]
MQIDIQIDALTPCLVERETEKIVDTTIERIRPLKKDYSGWNFDWSVPLRNNYEIYALKIMGTPQIQGLIALKIVPANAAVHIDIIETAPHNYGRTGKYIGVGGHLFAFACKLAQDNGYDYVYFDAKTNLIEYYKKALGAVQIGRSQRMIIEGKSFDGLLNKYYGGNQHE